MSNFERVLQRWRKHRCIRPAPPRHLRVSSLVNRRRPATATNLHHLQLDCTTLLVPLVRKSTLFFCFTLLLLANWILLLLFRFIFQIGSNGGGGVGALGRTPSISDHQRQLPEKRPDPVREVWPDMLVKIADLGNACWVVSVLSFLLSFLHCKYGRP